VLEQYIKLRLWFTYLIFGIDLKTADSQWKQALLYVLSTDDFYSDMARYLDIHFPSCLFFFLVLWIFSFAFHYYSNCSSYDSAERLVSVEPDQLCLMNMSLTDEPQMELALLHLVAGVPLQECGRLGVSYSALFGCKDYLRKVPLVSKNPFVFLWIIVSNFCRV